MQIEHRILIVEDDECLQTALQKALHSIDPTWVIQWVTTARDAFRELRKHRYEMVIADYLLPEFETGLLIWDQCQKTFPQMPFLLMSGISVPSFLHVTRGRRVCPRFLPKPFFPREFKEAVSCMIEEAHHQR